VTADKFRATLKELGMSQTDLRVRLGLNKSTTSRYAKGQLVIPLWMSAYLEAEKKVQTLQNSA
jgi:hypothetical protein